MKKLRYILLIIAAAALQVSFAQQLRGTKSTGYIDTFADERFVSQFAKYSWHYPFINYSENYVEWANSKGIETFFARLAKANHKKVKVLHIGDSHIQADFFTGYIRENIQKIFGYGGRGFIFPYACAGTHATYDYRTWSYGKWTGARNVKNPDFKDIGITGAVAQTNDASASFKFGFKEGILMPDFTVLKIYCKKSAESYDLKIKLNNQYDTIFVKTNVDDNLPYIKVLLPSVADTFQVFINQTDAQQNHFECYGLMMESPEDRGILYNSVGINGAGFRHVLSQSLFECQLSELRPDLVIIDIGANDFYMGNFNEQELSANLNILVDMVKKASPRASVIVSCSQDIYRRKRNIATTYNFSQLTQNEARNNGFAWYNYYKVAGGRYSMLKWRRYNLAKADKVHLTTAGYNLKGDLYLNAILNSYLQFLRAQPETFDLSDASLQASLSSGLNFPVSNISLTDPENDPSLQKITHKVKKGEKLKTIAKKYGVNEYDIMDWNGMESAYVRPGAKLVIYKERSIAEEKPTPVKKTMAKEQPVKNTKTATASTGQVKHRVASGETLWKISQKHGVTVQQIKQWNNLSGDAIRVGQILIIKK